jgi:hypothetical protein
VRASPSTAARLVLLVGTAMASGYLWRAALEPSGAGEALRATPVAPPPRVVTVERLVPTLRGHRDVAHRRPATAAALTARRRRADSSVRSRRLGSQSSKPASKPTPSGPSKPPPKPPRPAPPRPAPPTTQPPQTAVASSPTTPAPTPPATGRGSIPPPGSPLPPPQPPSEPGRPGWGRGDDNHSHSGPPGGPKKNEKDGP